MKWLVAGAGALLCISGAFGLVTGYSIVQVERGWASMIAGAVVLSAGSILLAISALIARMETLARAHFAPAENPQEDFGAGEGFKAPSFGLGAALGGLAGLGAAARARNEAPDLPPPLPREIAVESLPTRDAEPEPAPPVEAPWAPPVLASEPAPEPVLETPLVETAQAEMPQVETPFAEPPPVETPERPAALRNFTFVFPPPEMVADRPDAEPAPEVEFQPAPEPVLSSPPPLPAEKPAKFNLSWLRRNKAAPPPEPELPAGPRISVIEEATVFASLETEIAQEAEAPLAEPEKIIEDDTREPALELAAEGEPEDEFISAAPVEPEAPPADVQAESTPDPFSDDWLARALAGADETTELPPTRFVPPSMRRAALEEARNEADTDAQTESADLPPLPEVAATERDPSAPPPSEIGRYKANDVAYIMYSDGSISAETANGTFRFGSLIELKNFIERGA